MPLSHAGFRGIRGDVSLHMIAIDIMENTRDNGRYNHTGNIADLHVEHSEISMTEDMVCEVLKCSIETEH